MIDTYFDRCDAASGYKPTRSAPISEDPRYYSGNLYATMIDRNVAEARDRLTGVIDRAMTQHRREMRLSIKPGSLGSLFTTTAKRKY